MGERCTRVLKEMGDRRQDQEPTGHDGGHPEDLRQWSNKDAMLEVHPPPSSHATAAPSAATARTRVPSSHESTGNKTQPAAIGNQRQQQQQQQPPPQQQPQQWSADTDEYDDTWTGSVSR